MKKENFKAIPGYEKYGVTRSGKIKSFVTDKLLTQYLLLGYYIVKTYRGSSTETLPVHRAVALAWVKNTDPAKFTIVNHKDANPRNNWHKNLEWTDHSGNMLHAIANGLRTDNAKCKVRDFFTKEVTYHDSVCQASAFMGVRTHEAKHLLPKMFGKLISGRYEFRLLSDPTPWFYENRSELVTPARYLITVKNEDGTIDEVYSSKAFLKKYQVYDCPKYDIPSMVEFAARKYPKKEFSCRDGYKEEQFLVKRRVETGKRTPVRAVKHEELIEFWSIKQCARHFNVDKATIIKRLDTGWELDGWIFTRLVPLVGND